MELHVFNSFEEATEFDARYNAGVTGVNHLANATKLIKNIYSIELTRENDLNIYFK